MNSFYTVEFFKGDKCLGFNVSKSPEKSKAEELVKLIRKAQPELKKAKVVYTLKTPA